MKFVLHILLILMLVTLVACSGGGTNLPGANLDPDVTIEGVVSNSVLSGQVYYYRNDNKICDDNEPSTEISSDGGTFILTGMASDSISSPKIAEITDPVARSINRAIVLITIPNQRLISPLTTLDIKKA